MAVRYDFNELRKPRRHDSGYLRVDAYLTRTGVFEYRTDTGAIRKELRPPEEVFHRDSLASFELNPVTLEHPPGLLTTANAKEFSVGAVGESVQTEGSLVRASLAIHHADAIAEVESGERAEISCGYSCDMDETPGEWKGQRYDAVQRNIRGNHVALVRRGRAGPDVRIRLDSAQGGIRLDAGDAIQVTPSAPPPPENNTVKIKLDGLEFDIADTAAQAITKVQTAMTAELDGTKAKLDASLEEAKQLKAKLDAATDPKALQAAITARVALETSARAVLGSDAKLDGLTEREVQLQVLAKARPEAKFDGKSDAYVAGAFDVAVVKADAAGTTGGVADARAEASRTDSTDGSTPSWMKSDSKAARARMLERLEKAGIPAAK